MAEESSTWRSRSWTCQERHSHFSAWGSRHGGGRRLRGGPRVERHNRDSTHPRGTGDRHTTGGGGGGERGTHRAARGDTDCGHRARHSDSVRHVADAACRRSELACEHGRIIVDGAEAGLAGLPMSHRREARHGATHDAIGDRADGEAAACHGRPIQFPQQLQLAVVEAQPPVPLLSQAEWDGTGNHQGTDHEQSGDRDRAERRGESHAK